MRRAPARLLVVVLGVLATLSVAGPAAAHVGGGAAGSNYDARVTSVTPDVPGIRVRVLQFGDEIELANDTATEVVVPGYDGEPYLRIGPDGVWRNANSAATYVNLDRFALVDVPAHAREGAAPDWEKVSTKSAYVWHDHRTHWMSEKQLPPQVAADPGAEHTVFEWTVPVLHGRTPIAIEGVLTWSPPPPPWLVWPVHVGLVLVALAAGLLARTPRPLGVLLVAGATAAVWHAAATPAPPESLSSHAGALLSAAMPALLAALVAGLGFRAALRGRGAMAGLMAVVLGWLLLVQGLPDVDVLWSANALSGGPQLAARIAVGLLVTLGFGLVAGGIAAVRRFRETPRPSGTTPSGATDPVPVG
ncbi:hypothetical protein [Blastococcus sp. PRF04-17]|uniref:hypothetical protein n=1 Tax=Blastococcus sp. PRF04-17 TaxID=2933797 RepID=UPI001FF5B4A8|nr:hypothetical protein [Blastococcus sp. PRF04-17]UOY03640.1 hypothetical protein MVA48_10050 [Blastococcus sp. PRF04-17]